MANANKLSKSVFQEFDSFDIALGLYHYLQHNWEGMDDKYQAFCQLTAPGMYRPARSEEYFDNIEGDALQVYDALTDGNYSEALGIVLNYKSED